MRKLLSAMLVFISMGLGSLPVSSNVMPLPEGTDVIQTWGPGECDPMTIVIDRESDVVVRKGCVVLVNGQFSSSETKALELHVDRQVVATRDYGGKYVFKWTADVSCGSYTLKVVELRRNSQRYSLWKSNIKVIDRNPLQITSPAPNSELLDPTPISVNVINGYKCSSLRLYVNGKAIGEAVNGELTWNVPVMPTGSYTLWFVGLSEQGLVRSDPVAVSIPTRIALAKPVADERVAITEESDKLTLAADLCPGVKARKVEFFCDGAKIAEAPEGSKDTIWQASDVAPGQHQLSVQVTVQSGHVYTSAQVAVNLENPEYTKRQKQATKEQQAQIAEKPARYGPALQGDEAQRFAQIQAKQTWSTSDVVYLGWQYFLGQSNYAETAFRLLSNPNARKPVSNFIMETLAKTQSVPSDQADKWVYLILPGTPAPSGGRVTVEGIPLDLPEGNPGPKSQGFVSRADALALAIILGLDYSDLLQTYTKDKLTPPAHRFNWKSYILTTQAGILRQLFVLLKSDPLAITLAADNATNIGDLNSQVPLQNAMTGDFGITLKDGLNAQITDYSCAIAGLQAAVKLVPNSGTLRWRLAMAYHKRAVLRGDNKDDYQEAISQYKEAMAIDKGLDIPAVHEKIQECEKYSK